MPTRQGGTVANRDSNRPRGYLTQRDRAALIYGDCSLECLIACWRGTSTAGPSHYRTCGVSSVTGWASASSADGALPLAKMLAEMGLTGLFSLGAQSRRAHHSL